MECYALRGDHFVQYDGTNSAEIATVFEENSVQATTATILSEEDGVLTIVITGSEYHNVINETDWVGAVPAYGISDSEFTQKFVRTA
jgi:hypothetical protein